MRFLPCIGALLVLSRLTPAQEPFTLIAIPDTQGYCEDYGPGYGHLYQDRIGRQIQWVVDNVETHNIAFVTHLGDVVQNFSNRPNEWAIAASAINRLHESNDPALPARVPYSLTIGNHDFDQKQWVPGTYDPPVNIVQGTTLWEAHFGAGRFRDRGHPWYGGDDVAFTHAGHVGTGLSTFQRFDGGGREFLHLSLELGAPDAALAWARTVLDSHLGTPTIVSTHGFTDASGARLSVDRLWRRDVGNSADEIWNELLRAYPQVFLVLCGHTGIQNFSVDHNDAGQPVFFQMVCPTAKRLPGDPFRNGAGWLWWMEFDPVSERIRCRTYSTELSEWGTNDGGIPAHAYPPASEGDSSNHRSSDFFIEFDWDARFAPTPASVNVYCSSETNSAGCLPFVAGYGVPSAGAAEPFWVTAHDVLPVEPGIFSYGIAPTSLPFHGGTLCVEGPRRLSPVQAATAPPGRCGSAQGRLEIDFNEHVRSSADPVLTVQQTVYAQWQQRDPNGLNGDTLTDAVRFTVGP